MHAHTVSSISCYRKRLSLILSKTESLQVDWDHVTIETIKDEECKDKDGNSIYDKKGKPHMHTDGTGFVYEDIALRCPGNIFKGSGVITPAFEVCDVWTWCVILMVSFCCCARETVLQNIIITLKKENCSA
ncbi:NADH dehydrogenase [ubiquinone] flavoprotein 1 [Psidium guajava]|nr:NADH dehydrogenase [ubiquinone] flavoprotein 1 [Psidium guajava]